MHHPRGPRRIQNSTLWPTCQNVARTTINTRECGAETQTQERRLNKQQKPKIVAKQRSTPSICCRKHRGKEWKMKSNRGSTKPQRINQAKRINHATKDQPKPVVKKTFLLLTKQEGSGTSQYQTFLPVPEAKRHRNSCATEDVWNYSPHKGLGGGSLARQAYR